jgi:SsrA-binding protein
MSQNKSNASRNKVAAENRRARYDYFVQNQLECGIALIGSEVKSLRSGKASISESYASIENGELWLINSYFPIYSNSVAFGHEERRKRKLLVKKRELSRLWHSITRDGYTLVPLKLFFNEKGLAKILIAVAKGKKLRDKRELQKQKDWNRQKARIMRERN